MSKERFMTVVYRIEDAEKSKAYRSAIGDAFASEGQIADTGLAVTGMSVYDEMSRVEYLEALLDGEGIDYDQPKS